jgi:NitT/TauT family transport system permease protein
MHEGIGARLTAAAQALLLPVALLALWETLGRYDYLPAGILPMPSAVLATWREWAFGSGGFGLNPYSGTWTATILFSARRVAQGFALAVAVGVPTGILIGWSRLAARGIDPLIQGLRPIPITAWLPFSIALFGIRDMGAVFLIGLGAFYPIVVNATHGARDVGRNLTRAAQMMGASRRDLVLRVVLPNALPAIFTGMRIGLGVAWTAVIVAEIVAVKSGLGYVLWDAYYVGRMDVVLADMISIGLAGFLSDRLMLLIAARVLHWRALSR